MEIFIHDTADGHVKTKIYIDEYYTKHFEDILVSFDQLHIDEQLCGSGMHINVPELAQCLSSTYHHTGECGVVYHATLTTKDGPIQEVAVKSIKSMVIE